jgi:hypothetical protein
MKPKIFAILDRAIEEGVRRGYHRAFKHVEKPTDEAIMDSIENAVMASICEFFTFDLDD